MNLPLFYIFMLAIGLAMDTLAVSIAIGISVQKNSFPESLKISSVFGISHFLMMVTGFYLACSFYDYIANVGHYAAFLLLLFIGIKMVCEALKKRGECKPFPSKIETYQLMSLALVTSVDALAAGVSLNILAAGILFPALLTGIVIFAFSFSGLAFGVKLGCKFGIKMEVLGGVVLIFLGLKILAEHVF
ncbi:MAG: manganese efflux pump MntP family protein [bacterium]